MIEEIQIQSLGQEDLLEEEMATHSSILPGKIPRTEKPGRLQTIGSQCTVQDQVPVHTHTHTHTHTHIYHYKSYKIVSGSNFIYPKNLNGLIGVCVCVCVCVYER